MAHVQEVTEEILSDSKDLNPWVSIPTFGKEFVMTSHNSLDTRKPAKINADCVSFLNRIGLLRMVFSVNGETRTYNGTASVFGVNKEKNIVYALTCGHNLRYFDPMQSKEIECSSVVFETRKTYKEGTIKSKAEKTFQVTQWKIHSKYDASKTVSPDDLAVIQFHDDDGYFMEKEEEMEGFSDDDQNNENKVHLYGYPVSAKGVLYGVSTDVMHKNNGDMIEDDDPQPKYWISQNPKTNLLQYNIPTSGGQSGSPIIKVIPQIESREEWNTMSVISVICGIFGVIMSVFNSFDLAVITVIFVLSGMKYIENKYNFCIIPKANVTRILSKQCKIVGVHTTGNDAGNIGIKLTKESLKWIKENIEEEMEKEGHTNKNTEVTQYSEDSVYCLKETPYL